MAKVRVSTLAKEFGMTSKELMGHLADMKIPAKSASSTLEDAYVAMVRKQLASVIEARAQEVEAAKQAEEQAAAAEEAARAAEAERERIAAEKAREEERRQFAAAQAAEEAARAEAEAKAHENLGEGIRLLNEFMNNYRIVGGSYDCTNMSSSVENFTNELMLQKRIEFWGEGIPFWYKKRLALGIDLANSNCKEDSYRFVVDGRAPWWNCCLLYTSPSPRD